MASVSGMSTSNMNSLYGNRNVLSGLASGMDTEGMIENSISGFRLKISGLMQQQTKLQWKQDAYQGISDKLVQFSRKYSSYTSSTNLMSASFFNKAVITSASGANSSKVSATGRSNSSIDINGVSQLAGASRYQIDKGGVLGDYTGDPRITGGEVFDLDKFTDSSNVAGTMVLNYGDNSVALSFTSDEVYNDADEFATAIRKKLEDQRITTSSGASGPASDFIDVSVSGGKITFSDKKSNNSVYVKTVIGKLDETLDTKYDDDVKNNVLDLSGKDLKTQTSNLEKLSGETMSFTLDGSTKKVIMPTKEEFDKYVTDNNIPAADREKAFAQMVNDKLADSFGSGKITVGIVNATSNDPTNPNYGATVGALQFTIDKGSSLSVNSNVNEVMGLYKSESTYLNTSKTLGDLFGLDSDGKLNGLTDEGIITVKPEDIIKKSDGTFMDREGNTVDKDGQRLGTDGKPLHKYSMDVNGEKFEFHRDTALESVMVAINGNSKAGVSLTYSKLTNQLVFTAKETGSGHGISFTGGLAEKLFGTCDTTAANPNYKKGTDAVINVTVNGSNVTLTRSTNTFDLDGMSLTLKETFNNKLDSDGKPVLDGDGKPTFDFMNPGAAMGTIKDPVTFKTVADADKIVEAIKGMVTDFNAMMEEIRGAYNTLPAEKSDGSRYEPLTESDLESMTETAIENYEAKAKRGVVFGDQDLSSMYGKFLSAISPSGADGLALRNMGINTDYSQGLTTINLDEEKLRQTLSSNPDAVRDAFTKTAGNGTTTDGLMVKLRDTLDAYASTEGTKGILINKAGSKYSAASLLKNGIKDQMDVLDKQIEKWQEKMTTKVDFYTRQFTRLEQMIAQANSQSSSLMGMMGGG